MFKTHNLFSLYIDRYYIDEGSAEKLSKKHHNIFIRVLKHAKKFSTHMLKLKWNYKSCTSV